MGTIERAIVEGKAWGRLSAFVGVMSVMLVWMYLDDHSPRIRVDQGMATVLQVKQAGWQVKLGTGEDLWIYAAPGVTVRPGEVVPVVIETYESGRRIVQFDRPRWMMGG
jgi:hypothetical protein